MTQVIERQNLMNGQIHFRSKISREEVIQFARGFKDWYGDGIKLLAVRSCGNNRFGIVFAVEYAGGRTAYDKAIDEMTDTLKRTFGNDASWDISSQCWEVQ
jgi:hypothetical protein